MTTTKGKIKSNLSARILIAMIAGAILGLLVNLFASDVKWITDVIIGGFFYVIGSIFITSLQMMVVPLVFVSLVVGASSLSNPAKLGRLGGKAVFLYLVTTCIAISSALFFAIIVQPGVGVPFGEVSYEMKEAPSVWQVIIGMFPKNPVKAMAEGNMLQIIIFSILFGIAVALTGESGQRVRSFFEDLNNVIMELVIILMNLAPIGVFALITRLFSELGWETFAPLLKYFFLVLFVLIVHATVTYPLLLKLLANVSPIMFLRKMRPVMLFAFSTASSNATLPVTLRTVTQRLGVSNSTASFTVPLGATINMDGTAIMQGVATVFIAQAYGVDLTISQLLTVIMMATLASIGTAGVPGVGLILLATVLQQVGLPVEGIAIIIGVDRLLDMTRTAVNVTGDSAVSTIVDKSEGTFKEDVFNDISAAVDKEHIEDQFSQEKA